MPKNTAFKNLHHRKQKQKLDKTI